MPDAASVAPHFYKILEENSRVRILEGRGKIGDVTGMHTHPNLVAIPLVDAKERFTSPDGDSMELEFTAGQPVYVEAVEHSTEVLSEVTHVILVELKG